MPPANDEQVAAALDHASLSSQPAAAQSLDVQAALLPYALALFAVGLPIYGWLASFASDRAWAAGSLVVFAINWAAFYGVTDWFRRNPKARADTAMRTRVHVMAGLLWAGATAQITAVGLAAGVASSSILMVAVGVAATCVFFSAPVLPALLIVSPAAAAAPIAALFMRPHTELARPAMAAMALVMALSLIMNRLLRRQFALAADRERLIAAGAEQLARVEQLAKSKSALLATLSNEIRNGLTGVAHVLASAAGTGGRAAPSREQLGAALSATESLLGVLGATVDVETAETGQLALERQPVDLARIAQELVLLGRPQAVAKALELSLQIDPEFGSGDRGAVMGDAVRVRQVLGDLLTNALKYTVRGRIELRLSRPDEWRVRVEVVDTGPGLTPDELAMAFEPFERIARTAAGVPGAGLGLPLARRLAALMGGEVSVESAVGVGCCFRLDLPFDPTVSAPALAAAEPAGPAGLAPSLRVLVAMDDALSAAMLRAVLEQLGHQVLQAHDGRRACELVEICQLDLIMLDSRLPLMDGPQTARAIRQIDGPAANTPIIAVIGGDPEEATAYLEAGVDQVLRRPLAVAGVARALAEAMREDRATPKRRSSSKLPRRGRRGSGPTTLASAGAES